MSSSFNLEPGHAARSNTLKLAVVGGVVLLLIAGGALAYVGVSAQRAQNAAAASTALAAAAAPAGHPTVAIGTVSGAPNVPVEVPVKLAAVAGLGSASLTLTYDPKVVTLTDARNGNVARSQLTWRHDTTDGVIVMLLTTSLPHGLQGDGVLAILTLTAKDGAVGQVSPLAIGIRSAVASDGKDATLDASSGSFRNGVPGDVNGDGKVDTTDYDRLAHYLVGEDVPIVALNADLNGDGKVTDADAILLLRQLDAGANGSAQTTT